MLVVIPCNRLWYKNSLNNFIRKELHEKNCAAFHVKNFLLVLFPFFTFLIMNFHGDGVRGQYYLQNSLKRNNPRFNAVVHNGKGYNHDTLFGNSNGTSAFPLPNDGENNQNPNFQKPFHQQARANNNLQNFRSQPDLLALPHDYKLSNENQRQNVPTSVRDPLWDPYATNSLKRHPFYPSNTSGVNHTSSLMDRRDYNSNSLRLPAQNGPMQRWASSDNIHRRPKQEFTSQPSLFTNQKYHTLNPSSNPYTAPQRFNRLRYPQQYPTTLNGFGTLPSSVSTLCHYCCISGKN